MAEIARYAVWPILLTSAGSEEIDGPWALIRMIRAVDGSGIIDANALVNVRPGDPTADSVPLGLGMALLVRGNDKFTLSWEAQAGVTAQFLVSADPSQVDADADPPAQLVAGTVNLSRSATVATVADVTLTAATATQIVAADTTRREVLITNLTGAVIRVGDSSITATRGVEVPNGGTITLETTAAVLGFSTPGGTVAVTELRD